MNFLLIDDDQVDRMHITRTLDTFPQTITCTEAPTAEQGLALMAQHQYDMVLLDYNLPGLNGLEVLRLIAENDCPPPGIVMLSHSDDSSLALSCIEAGAQDFLRKEDISRERLMQAISHAQKREALGRQMQQQHRSLRKLAENDFFTTAPKRSNLIEALHVSVQEANRTNTPIAVLLLDLDKFKQINNSLGLATGDLVLQAVAERLNNTIQEGQQLYRLGGDEFGIIINDLAQPDSANLLSQRILDCFKTPFYVEERVLSIATSIGIATYSDCAGSTNQLLDCADIALYRSKEAGGNVGSFYSQILHGDVTKRIELEQDLRTAVAHKQLELHYQAQVGCDNEQLLGVEALIRWHHPKYGLISPQDFIPVAEKMGLIGDIGEWVIKTACAQYAHWQAKLVLPFTLSINISPEQLVQKDLAAIIQRELLFYGVPAKGLEIEITETTLISEAVSAGRIQQLVDMGLRVAIDDFGTGYSSLARLHKAPISVIKIDKEFFDPIVDKSSDISFLTAIQRFTKTLGFEVVAEGIETQLQRDLCLQLGFDRIQGYFYGRPMSASEFAKQWLDWV
ncbi:putative bifunctional diguanylate cyclase/phosphodiesterase [Reinekea sp.]|jgi:diguanylate cyclase (GGDEF)-like protein|uniref:putative bifunctional diguanylate cyclase/phosphodiesterase n=1 Tax=Reinekea sp. TaxID=1970455 RepID=UPI002A813C45|nr:EAL domain-containing protein [Reinekea sp.]